MKTKQYGIDEEVVTKLKSSRLPGPMLPAIFTALLIAVAWMSGAAAEPTANAGWEEPGTGSASGGGISKNDDSSSYPSLAIGPEGYPIVAWNDFSNGDDEIYVRRWNGSAWLEMGNGSTFGGGISNYNGEVLRPSIAIAPDDTPVVAWHNDTDGNSEIFVRRYVDTHRNFLPGTFSNDLGGPTCHPGNREIEPNDHRPDAGANGPFCFNRTYNGRPTDQWDVFAYDLDAAGAVNVTVNNHRGPGVVLIISDSRGIALAQDLNAADGLQATYNAPARGRYYVALFIAQPNINEATEYTLFATFNVPPPTCYSGSHEREPNNGIGDANRNGPFCFGKIYRGLPRDDWDLFAFDLPTAGNMTAVVENHRGANVVLQITDANKNVLASDANATDGLRATYNAPAPGRYFVALYIPQPDVNETAEYTLQVSTE